MQTPQIGACSFMKLLTTLAVLYCLGVSGALADGPNTGDTELDADLTAIIATRDSYIDAPGKANATAAERAVLDNSGWVTPEATCDSTLFSGLYAAGGSRNGQVNSTPYMPAAISFLEPGRVYRTPAQDCVIWSAQLNGWRDNGSKNSASADMYFGLLYWAYASTGQTRIQILSAMINYLNAHPGVAPGWKETGVAAKFKKDGTAFPAFSNLTPFMAPPLQGTICEVYKAIGGTDDVKECRLRFTDAGFVGSENKFDYTANLEAMHVLIRILVTGGVTAHELTVAKTYAERPMMAFYKAIYAYALSRRVHKRIAPNPPAGDITYSVEKTAEAARADNKKDICKYGKEAAQILRNNFVSQTSAVPNANPAQSVAQAFAGQILFPPVTLPGEADRDTYYLWQRQLFAGGAIRNDWKPNAASEKLFSGTDFLIASWILLQVPFDCGNLGAAPNPPPLPTAAPVPTDDVNFYYTDPAYQPCLSSTSFDNEVDSTGTALCPMACVDGSICTMVYDVSECTGTVEPNTICMPNTPTPMPTIQVTVLPTPFPTPIPTLSWTYVPPVWTETPVATPTFVETWIPTVAATPTMIPIPSISATPTPIQTVVATHTPLQ